MSNFRETDYVYLHFFSKVSIFRKIRKHFLEEKRMIFVEDFELIMVKV